MTEYQASNIAVEDTVPYKGTHYGPRSGFPIMIRLPPISPGELDYHSKWPTTENKNNICSKEEQEQYELLFHFIYFTERGCPL
jgi:hypothetical protein